MHPEFTLHREFPIEEINCTFRELTHNETGATVIHLENDDPENLFCISFRTTPLSSNGVAHILEHLVLCGSEKYPAGDPFFAMTRRSLNTFMNAMTGSDFTCYPCATQNKKDFYNLLEVYADCVFRPTLERLSFLQEGHRFEFSEEGKLTYNGVVFNEMKGGMSSPTSRLHECVYAKLFPDTTYGQNSGGDPRDIPNLSYEELLEFHQEFYHPSRCHFFFYGDLPLREHLDFISEHALKGVKPTTPLTPIPHQKHFTHPVSCETSYPGEADGETYLSVGWVTEVVEHQVDVLALVILEIALMGTDASPLKRALYDSGLCSQISAHIEADMADIPLTITFKDVLISNRGKLEEVLLQELKRIAQEGVDRADIESAMHQVEFHRSEISDDNYPHGLSLFFRSVLLRQQGVAPEEGLKIHSLFNALRKKWEENPNYFEDLISKWLVDNPHRVSVFMEPDPSLAQKELEEEQQRLKFIEENLSPGEREEIVEDSVALIKKQEEEVDNNSFLPGLTRDDIRTLPAKDYPLASIHHGNAEVFHHDCFTNRVLYADISFDLPQLQLEMLPSVRFCASLLHQVGAGGRSYTEQLDRIQADTGGIATMLGSLGSRDDADAFTPTLSLKGKALYRNIPSLFELMRDILVSADLTNGDRIREIIRKQAAQFRSSLVNQSMGYAASRAKSALRPYYQFSNEAFGLPYYRFITSLEDRMDEVIATLAAIQEQLIAGTPHVILSCDADEYASLAAANFHGVTDIAVNAGAPWKQEPYESKLLSEAYAIPASVAFISRSLPTVPYTHPDAPALSVIASLMNQTVLHKRIREQGGAYGGGCSQSSKNGVFTYYSYRDPNIASTFAAFDEALESILAGDFTDTELFDGVLDILQDVDSPISPGSRADVGYHWLREGADLQTRETYRQRLIAIEDRQALRDVAARHLTQNGSTVVFGGEELIKRENKKLKEPLTTIPLESA